MNKQQLVNERDQYKKKVITFSVLTGIIIMLLFTIVTIFIGSSMVLEGSEEDTFIAGVSMFVILFSYIALILYMIFVLPACDMFTAFIIVNAIKLGKRNNLLNKMETEEQVILVEEHENN